MFRDLFLWLFNRFKKNNTDENNEINKNNTLVEKDKKSEKNIRKEIEAEIEIETEQKLQRQKKEEKKREKESSEKEKDSKKSIFKKFKRKKKKVEPTIFFALSLLVLIWYLISFVFSFTFSENISFVATINRIEDPYRISYDILTRPRQANDKIGTTLLVDNTGHVCLKESNSCYDLEIVGIAGNLSYYKFRNLNIQKTIDQEAFFDLFVKKYNEKYSYIKNYKISGKIVNNIFHITKIEINEYQ